MDLKVIVSLAIGVIGIILYLVGFINKEYSLYITGIITVASAYLIQFLYIITNYPNWPDFIKELNPNTSNEEFDKLEKILKYISIAHLIDGLVRFVAIAFSIYTALKKNQGTCKLFSTCKQNLDAFEITTLSIASMIMGQFLTIGLFHSQKANGAGDVWCLIAFSLISFSLSLSIYTINIKELSIFKTLTDCI